MTNRPLDSGRRDALGRTIRVSGDAATGRADAPLPPDATEIDVLSTDAAPKDQAEQDLHRLGVSVEQMQKMTGFGRRNIPGCKNTDTILNKYRAGALSAVGVMGDLYGLDSPQHRAGHAWDGKAPWVGSTDHRFKFETYVHARGNGKEHESALSGAGIDEFEGAKAMRYRSLRDSGVVPVEAYNTANGIEADTSDTDSGDDDDAGFERDFTGDDWRDELDKGDEVRIGPNEDVGVIVHIRHDDDGNRLFHVAIGGDMKVFRAEEVN